MSTVIQGKIPFFKIKGWREQQDFNIMSLRQRIMAVPFLTKDGTEITETCIESYMPYLEHWCSPKSNTKVTFMVSLAFACQNASSLCHAAPMQRHWVPKTHN